MLKLDVKLILETKKLGDHNIWINMDITASGTNNKSVSGEDEGLLCCKTPAGQCDSTAGVD